MKPKSKLPVADRVILPGAASTTFNTYWDLLMLVVPSGRERTETEFTQLYKASGFQLTRIVPTTPISIIEGKLS